MDKDLKIFLQRMIKYKGYIAQGTYNEGHRFWTSSTQMSGSLMDVVIFYQLRKAGYIRKDVTGRYWSTDKGRKFALPWYKKIFDVI